VAKVHIDPIAVHRHGVQVTLPLVKGFIRETVALSKKWPRAGNPAWTDSTGALNRATTGQTYSSPSPHGYVRNDKPYALAVHEGTPPRLIFALTEKGMNFWWKREGRRGRKFAFVKHPATKGSHFLSGPAKIVAKKYHFKVNTNILP
jgi:hypothetical protein